MLIYRKALVELRHFSYNRHQMRERGLILYYPFGGLAWLVGPLAYRLMKYTKTNLAY